MNFDKIGDNYYRHKEITAHCPKCGKLALRRGEPDLKESDSFSYSTLCPHCKAPIRIVLSKPVIIYIDN